MGTVKSKKLLGFYTHSVHVGKTGFGSLGGSPLTNRCTYRLLGKQRSFDGSAVPFLNPLKKDFLNPFIEFDIRKCVCMRVCVYAFFSCLFNKYISLWKKKDGPWWLCLAEFYTTVTLKGPSFTTGFLSSPWPHIHYIEEYIPGGLRNVFQFAKIHLP